MSVRTNGAVPDLYLWGGFSSQLPTFNPVTASPRGRYPDTRPDSRTTGGMVRIDLDGPFPPRRIWLGIPLPFGRAPARQVVGLHRGPAAKSGAATLTAALLMGIGWPGTTSACPKKQGQSLSDPTMLSGTRPRP